MIEQKNQTSINISLKHIAITGSVVPYQIHIKGLT